MERKVQISIFHYTAFIVIFHLNIRTNVVFCEMEVLMSFVHFHTCCIFYMTAKNSVMQIYIVKTAYILSGITDS
jgi:hypothetical protein